MDAPSEKVIPTATEKAKTIKAYYKLCQKPENRGVVLKDKVFFGTLPTLLKDDNLDVIKYAVKILVLLTEKSDDIETLLKSNNLLSALSEACEIVTSPSINYNLVLVTSRIRAVKASAAARINMKELEPLANSVKELDKGSIVHRKFVGRKSKQITIEFDPDEFDELKKRSIERLLLNKKGVISVYITEHNLVPRAVLRTILNIEATEIARAIFETGVEYVAQIVKLETGEERFEMYASQYRKTQQMAFPEYIDDEEAVADPKSCVVTTDMVNLSGGTDSGWFSSFTSFVKTTLW